MELTPLHEGDTSSAGHDNLVILNQSQIQVLHVQSEAAAVRPLVLTLPVAGRIEENITRHRVLAAYVDGRIDKLHVNYEGAEVVAGQPLAELYSPVLLQAEREYRLAGPNLRHPSALRLRQLGLSPKQIEALPGKPAELLSSSILSPVSGTVVTRNAFEGQYVSSGEKLFEIADFSTMWFVFQVYEQDLPWIRPGLTVRVNTPSHPGKSFSGSIEFIDPNLNPDTRAANVRAELANPLVDGRRELLNHLYADGLLEFEAPKVLTIPRSAVIATGPESIVYIVRDGGAYERTALRLGRRGDSHVEVLAGLRPGDAVVTNGNLLIDGQAEMNRAFASPPESKSSAPAAANPSSAPAAAFNPSEQAALAKFLQVADAMAAALAKDDLTEFNKVSAAAMAATEALAEPLKARALDPAELLEARHFHGLADLAHARVAFHRFSQAATSAMQAIRRVNGTPPFGIFECGMVDEAIPGVPPKGRWIQTGTRPLQNPFFGPKMLDCGSPIQP